MSQQMQLIDQGAAMLAQLSAFATPSQPLHLVDTYSAGSVRAYLRVARDLPDGGKAHRIQLIETMASAVRNVVRWYKVPRSVDADQLPELVRNMLTYSAQYVPEQMASLACPRVWEAAMKAGKMHYLELHYPNDWGDATAALPRTLELGPRYERLDAATLLATWQDYLRARHLNAMALAWQERQNQEAQNQAESPQLRALVDKYNQSRGVIQ